MPETSFSIGAYRIFEGIGQGGTAKVFRGETPDSRQVAVKVLADLDDPAAVARFEREARTLARLSHPSLPPLLDHGVDDELGPYLVTPLVPGLTARALFAGVRVCPEGVLLVLSQVAGALGELHKSGLVHRDLKPENLMVTPAGHVMLLDLGLTYRAGQTRYTEEGQVVGSIPYMSPEQIEGRGVTAAADVWSAAVMAYEWLCGARPFQRERPAEEAAAVLAGVFTPLSAADRRVSDATAHLIERCLSRDAGARPRDGAELLAELSTLYDWFDPDEAAAERAALFAGPAEYQGRVAPVRVARLKREARSAISDGEAFVALKIIDRALAYAPDDAELMTLSAEAEERSEPARKARRRAYVLAGALLAVFVVMAFVFGRQSADAPPPPAPLARSEPAPAPKPEAAVEIREKEAAFLVAEGMLTLFEKGLEIDGVHRPAAGATDAEKAFSVMGRMLQVMDKGMERHKELERQKKDATN